MVLRESYWNLSLYLRVFKEDESWLARGAHVGCSHFFEEELRLALAQQYRSSEEKDFIIQPTSKKPTAMMMKLISKITNPSEEPQLIATPAQYDVLCGKDKTYAQHPGNQVFRQRIESWVSRYQNAANKQEKMKFTRQIVESMVAEYGTRFIKPHLHGAWVEISDQMARDKVSHALRFAANHEKKKKLQVQEYLQYNIVLLTG